MTRKKSITPADESAVNPEDRIKVTYVNVSDLKPYGRNPRINEETVKLLENSFRDFGLLVPLVVTRDGTIITGHTRLKAAVETGRTAVPCIIAEDLDDAKAKMFRLADNKIQEISSWDFDLLPDELDDLKDMGFEPEDYGFTPLDLGAFDDDPEEDGEDRTMPPAPTASDDLMVSEEAGPAVRPGDVLVFGKAELVCAAVELEDIEDAPRRKPVRLFEPDPAMCEALARGWAEEHGSMPVLVREGKETEWPSDY